MEQYIVWIGVAVVFAVLWYLKRPDISSADARKLVAEGARLVDVRTPGEFAAGHVEGARNIPVSEISRRTKELGPTDRPIVLYCASGSRSAMAKRTLRGAGYSKVYNLGSMRNW